MIKLVDSNDMELDLTSFGPTVGIGWNREEQATGSFANLTSKIPKRDEIFYYGTENGDLSINVELWTNSMNLEAMDSLWTSISEFAFDVYGKPKLLKMYVSYWLSHGIEKYRWVRLHQAPIIEYGNIFFKLPLSFAAVDRFKYGPDRKIAKTGITTTHTMEFDFKGFATPPLITLVGDGTAITLESDGKTIEVGAMPTGAKTIVIDTTRYVAYRNGVDGLMRIPENFLLTPWGDLKVMGSGLNLSMTVDYRERFL